MKIEITVKEIQELKKIISASNEAQKKLIKAIDGYEIDTPEVNMLQLIEAINNTKMYKVGLGLGCIVVEINPEYMVDFLSIYSKCIVACGNAVVALVNSFKELEGDFVSLSDKWF